MEQELEAVLARNEHGPLDKFRNQSKIYKQYGDEGIKVYSAIGPGTKVRDLLAAIGMDENKLIEMLEFMDSNELIMLEQGAIGPGPSARRAEAEHEIMHEVSEREEELRVESPRPLPKSPPPYAPKAPASIRTAPLPEATGAAPALSPLEKKIYQKFGKTGLTVYGLIDGEKTAEEILNEASISEVQLVEILEFMDKEGIIRLEKPAPAARAAGMKGSQAKPRFEPMLEDKKALEETIAEDLVPIDLIVKHHLEFPNDLLLKLDLFVKFNRYGSKVYGQIDGKKDNVQLASITGVSLKDTDGLLAFLGKRGAALMRPLKPEEVRMRYGEDGLSIYRRYGREGVFIYELIGKEQTVKDIVQKSRVPKDRAVDIFIYIHKVLGLELPISRETLLRQLS